MQLAGNVFLITGGGSGLGAACARRFAAAGARVVVADVNVAAGETLAAELDSSALFVSTDVTSPEQVQAALAAAQSLGPLRGAINCAGILAGARLVGRDGPHDLALFNHVIQINLVGTFNVARLAADAMSRLAPDESGERGVIINTASIAVWEGQIGQAAYAASKGGVASMTLPLARELARVGIRVVAIAPGIFETAMMAGAPPPVVESLTAQTVFPPRLGRPEEYAQFAQQIVENSMFNGAVVRLDGAVRMSAK